MGDDWDAEDYEIPAVVVAVPPKPSVKANWDDEEEVVEVPAAPAGPTPAELLLRAKKAQEEEARLLYKLQNAHLESESADERKLRERRMAEESDNSLANEIFTGTAQAGVKQNQESTGLGGIPMKTRQDHVNFAVLAASKMESSTAFNTAAFLKEFINKAKNNLTTECLDDLISVATAQRDEKKKNEPKAKVAVKQSKKQIESTKKKHADKYGAAEDDEGAYDHYSAIEDDFM